MAHIRPQADDRLYQAVFESTGTAMMIVDEKIIIRRVNSEVESVSGYRRDEVEGRALSDFIPADEFKRIMEYHELRKIDPSAPPRRYEFRFINRVGAERYAYITVAHIPETGMTIASFIDITEKKHMEEALRQSEEKHRNLVETMNEGFGSTDENHCLTYANQKFADMLGYTKAEILGRSLKEFIPADYQDAIEDQIARRKNGEAERYEMVWTDKKGNRVMTLVSPMGLFDFHSRFIGTFSTITDITDMKRIEGALRDSEETFRLLAEYAPIGISLMRPDRTFEYFNPPFVEIFGYDIGDLPDKQTWFEKAYPDPLYREQVAGRWTQDYINVNDKGSLRNRRFTVRCKGGVEKHIHFRGSILGNGKHLMTYEDVTELVKAEEALRESERMYREFVEFLPQSMFEFNLDGIFTFANKHALETFGFSKDDLADGVSVFDLMPPHERSRAAETIEKILQRDHRGAMEYTAVRKDGTAFPVMVYSAPLVTDGRLRGIRGIIVDITELKQAEHALRESETRFRTLIESARDSIFIKDRTLRYALVNPALARLLKGTVSELTGKSDEDFFDDEMVSVIRDEDMKVLSGETIEEEHVMFMRGDARTFHVIKTPMRDNEGHIIGLCGIARDVTELRKMENHFRDAQKMEAIGTLAGGIAHDFNNILMAIQGYTSLLLLNLGADHPHYEKLKKIETNVESGADLTRQLLGFAQSGRYEIKPMELNAVLEKTAHMFTRTRKEITIHRSYQDSLWIVDADRGQMEQVFLNLFINAG
ncbi:MAG: PAS domain S-box protein, partial [Deltaproteobacteria bacterium]|nr:PAS domain S-box protein [Deltaproteobacteria bacterium]